MELLNGLPKMDSDKASWPWTEETDPSIYDKGINWPKISLVTPSFNQGQFIEETIRSVLLQNYPNLEYIVIDGGSTDNTIEVIRKYEPWITYWASEKDKGQSDAINKGFNRCTGQIMNWLNSDDYLLKDALYHIGKYAWGENTGALVGKGYIINQEKEIIYTPSVGELSYEALLRWMQGNSFMQPACYFTKKAWDTCGPLDEDLNFCLDVDLWLKISKQFEFERLDQDIAFAYGHDQAKTIASELDSRIETAFLIYGNGNKDLAINEIKRVIEMAIQKENAGWNPVKTLIKKVSGRLGIK